MVQRMRMEGTHQRKGNRLGDRVVRHVRGVAVKVDVALCRSTIKKNDDISSIRCDNGKIEEGLIRVFKG